MRRSLVLAAATLTVGLLAGACGSSVSPGPQGSGTAQTTAPGGPASGAPADDAKVAWVDKVCGEIIPLASADSGAPPNLADPDSGKAVKAFGDYIGQSVKQIETAVANLKNAGPSPIEGGDAALAKLVGALEALRQSYQESQAKLSKVNTKDQAAAQSALVEAFAKLSAGGNQLAQTVQSVEADQGIAAAVGQAPNCQKLNQGASAPPTT
jgi:hypothetical protein